MATATAVGGKGGDSSDPAGNGGNANATANATAGGVAAEATATATGGAGGAATVGAPGIGGDATATANAVSLMDGGRHRNRPLARRRTGKRDVGRSDRAGRPRRSRSPPASPLLARS
jgi:hypothetical protein